MVPSAKLRNRLMTVALLIVINGSIATLVSFQIASRPQGGIQFEERVDLDKPSPAAYLPGEPVRMLFSLANYQSINVSIPSKNGCILSYEIRQRDTEGPLVYDSLKHSYCLPDSAIKTLGPHETYSNSMTWNQTDDAGASVPDGQYEAMTTYAGFDGPAGQLFIGKGVPTTGNFYFEGNTPFTTYPAGTAVRINVILVNQATEIVQVGLSTCSFSYDILSDAGSVIYNSTRNADCRDLIGVTLVAPQGSLGQVFYWEQYMVDFPIQVPSGNYTIVVHAFVYGGTQRFDFNQKLWPIRITSNS